MISSFFKNCYNSKIFCFFILLMLFLWFLAKNPDVALMLFISIIFACSLNPLVNKLSKKMSRGLAATLVLTGTIVVCCIFIIPILVLGAYQIGDFATHFPQYIKNIDDNILSLPILNQLELSKLNTKYIFDSFATSSSNIIDIIVAFISNASEGFLYIFTTIMFIFFLLVDNKLIKNSLLKLFPSEIRKRADNISTIIGKKLGGYVVAQTLVSGSVWVIMTIGLLLFHIDYAVILGLIAGVLSIIPMVGSFISFVICIVATYVAGLKAMIIVTVLFAFSHFIENHVVRPYVYSKFLDIHPMIVFLALLVGAKYAGVMGIIFAPPIAMALCILINELHVKKMD